MVPLSGRLYDRLGPRWPVVAGLLVMAYGSYLLAQLNTSTSRADIELWTSIRNVGTGLALIAIITSGVSSLRPELTGSGSAMNNVMQRVASSVAVAVFSGLNMSASAQLLADRGGLYGLGPMALPEVREATEQGATGLLPLYQRLTAGITTETYDNGFYIVALMCVGAAILALFLRSGRTPPSTERGHVEL
jgi:MFS family permease